MITSRLLPGSVRRKLVDAVYGSDGAQNLIVYAAGLWVAFLILALLLLGRTPWNAPAQADTAVPSLPYLTCSTLGIEEGDGPATSNRSSARRAASTPSGDNVSNCPGLAAADVQDLRSVARLAARIRNGVADNATSDATATDLDIASEGAARQWVNRYVCHLGGATGETRGALAWFVWQGYGRCSTADRNIAAMPLTIWLGPIVGMLLTALILFASFFVLLRHSLRLPSTWRAYRRLYGSEHRVG